VGSPAARIMKNVRSETPMRTGISSKSLRIT